MAAQLLPDETRRLHAAYADALATAPADQRSATEIASHWDAAGEQAQALAAHVAAAKAAQATFAYEEACRHALRALELWDHVPDAAAVIGAPHAAIVATAAAATAKAGDLSRAIDLTRQLIAELGGDDAETRELARSSLRWYLWEAGDLESALAETDAVADGAPARWRANALAHRAGILLYLRRTASAAQTARQALVVADSVTATEEHILAEGVLGWCLLLEGDIEAGLASIRRALDAAVATEGARPHDRYPVGPVLAHAQLATALELVGRFDELHDTALAGATVAVRQGLARTYGSVLRAAAARALYQVGRWDEAAATVDEALREGAVSAGRVALLTVRALLAVGHGEQLLVERSLADADRLADGVLPVDVRRWLTVAQADDALWRGDPLDALTRIGRLAGDAAGRPGVGLGGPPAVLDASIPPLLALGARACADLAIRERASDEGPGLSVLATSQVEASLRRVRRQPALAAAWAGDLAMARAELARTAPDAAARERRWKAAADLLTDRPYASAYVSWRLAEAHLARRDGRREAAAVIGRGLTIADRLHAKPLASELRDLAQRARLGVGPGPGAQVTVSIDAERRPFGLTAREVEVLVLLAEGLGNGEIAERLFISPKTASVHVSNIYAKLGVETRVAAATVGTVHGAGRWRSTSREAAPLSDRGAVSRDGGG